MILIDDRIGNKKLAPIIGAEMYLTDGTHEYQVVPMGDGSSFWLMISKDKTQVGNPYIDANGIIYLIKELKELLETMTKP